MPNAAEFTRPATWEDLKALVKRLNETGADYALVGGYAIAAHGFNRFSEDIDILVDPAAENSMRWILALSELPDHAARELAANAKRSDGHSADTAGTRGYKTVEKNSGLAYCL